MNAVTNRNIKTSDLRIQIDSSNAFSVGYKDESLSVPVVWASGAAGWFEIVPSQTYQRICDEMFQGVCLHYSFLEQYENALEQLQESRKKAKKKKATMADVQLDIDELLFQVCRTLIHFASTYNCVNSIRSNILAFPFFLVRFTFRRRPHSSGRSSAAPRAVLFPIITLPKGHRSI